MLVQVWPESTETCRTMAGSKPSLAIFCRTPVKICSSLTAFRRSSFELCHFSQTSAGFPPWPISAHFLGPARALQVRLLPLPRGSLPARGSGARARAKKGPRKPGLKQRGRGSTPRFTQRAPCHNYAEERRVRHPADRQRRVSALGSVGTRRGAARLAATPHLGAHARGGRGNAQHSPIATPHLPMRRDATTSAGRKVLMACNKAWSNTSNLRPPHRWPTFCQTWSASREFALPSCREGSSTNATQKALFTSLGVADS